MAEQEYERLQSFFFRPIVIESKQTVAFEDIKTGNIVPPPVELDISPLNKELEILQATSELSETIICAVCGGKYSHFNKNRHYLTKKHLSARPLEFPSPPQ